MKIIFKVFSCKNAYSVFLPVSLFRLVIIHFVNKGRLIICFKSKIKRKILVVHSPDILLPCITTNKNLLCLTFMCKLFLCTLQLLANNSIIFFAIVVHNVSD